MELGPHHAQGFAAVQGHQHVNAGRVLGGGGFALQADLGNLVETRHCGQAMATPSHWTPPGTPQPVCGSNPGGAVHIIQRVQCAVGVRVTVLALHEQFPSLLQRQSRPSTLPFLPRLGVGGPLAVFCQSCFVTASADLIAVQPLLGPFLW